MFPHHSDQMSQRSQVSSTSTLWSLCNGKSKSYWLSQWVSEWVSEWQGHLLSCCGQLKTLSCFDATTQPDYKFYNSETTMLWSRCMVSTQSEGRSLCTWASPSSPHRSPSPSGWEPSLAAWLVLSQYEKCILTMDVSPALVVGPSAYSGIYIGVWSYSALLTGHFPPLLTLFLRSS